MIFDARSLAVVEAAAHACWVGTIDTAAFAAFVWLTIALVRPSASARHILWWTVLVVATGVPVASFGGSLVRIHAVARTAGLEIEPPLRATARVHVAPAKTNVPTGNAADERSTASAPITHGTFAGAGVSMFGRAVGSASPRAIEGALIGGIVLWFLIALIKLLRLGIDLRMLGRVKRRATAFDRTANPPLMHWQRVTGAGRRAVIATSHDVTVPCLAGLRHPTILFPSDLVASAQPDDLDRIALHEYAHLARFDDWTQLAERIVGAALWFNPAILMATQHLALEREVACDDWVVARTGTPHGYASCLLRLAESVRKRQRFEGALGALGHRNHITERIAHLTTQRRASGRVSRLTIGTVVAAGVGVAVMQTLRAPAIAYQTERPAKTLVATLRYPTPSKIGTTATGVARVHAVELPNQQRVLFVLPPHDGAAPGIHVAAPRVNVIAVGANVLAPDDTLPQTEAVNDADRVKRIDAIHADGNVYLVEHIVADATAIEAPSARPTIPTDAEVRAASARMAKDAQAFAKLVRERAAASSASAEADARSERARAYRDEGLSQSEARRAGDEVRASRIEIQRALDAARRGLHDYAPTESQERAIEHAHDEQTRAAIRAAGDQLHAALRTEAEQRETELRRDLEQMREDLRRAHLSQPPAARRSSRNNSAPQPYIATTSAQGGS